MTYERQHAVCAWALERMESRDFCVVDTETTGFGDRAEIVQIVVVNAWGRVAFSSLVRPEEPIDEDGGAFAVNGISNAMVRLAPIFDAAYDMALGFMAVERIIAYNVEFDCNMLHFGCRRHNTLPIHGDALWDCAMLRYSEFAGVPGNRGGYRWHKLRESCAQMGLRLDRDWHEAGADAIATWELVRALAERAE